MADTNDLELNRNKELTEEATVLATTRDPEGPPDFVHMEDADNIHPNAGHDKDKASLSETATLEPDTTLDVSEDRPNSDIVGHKSTGQAVTEDGEAAEPPLSNEEQPGVSAEDARNDEDKQKPPSTLEEQDGGAESDISVEEEPSSQESEDDFRNRREVYDAVRRGDLEILKTTLAKISDINRMWRKGQNPLHFACRQSERTDVIKILLAKGVDVKSETKDRYLNTALHLAMQHGELSTVRLLLEKNANIEATDSNGETPIFDAVYWDHPKIVELLLNKGAKVNSRSTEGLIPLSAAILRLDHPDSMVDLLLDRCADVNLADEDGWTPLHYAALWNEEGAVKAILSQKVNLQATNKEKETALHVAVRNSSDDLKIIKHLVNAAKTTANLEEYVSTKNDDMETPLHVAYRSNAPHDVIQLLLENHSDPTIKNSRGKSVIGEAIRDGNISIIKLLLTKCDKVIGGETDDTRAVASGWLVNKENRTNELYEAVKGSSDRESFARALLDLDIEFDVEKAKDEGRTILHHLVEKGSKDLITRLLDIHGADTETKTKESNLTALLLAIKCGRKDTTAIMELLLEKGADIEAKTKESNLTALLLAIKCGRKDATAIMELLLEKGADIEAKTREEETALHLAVNYADQADQNAPEFSEENANQASKTQSGSKAKPKPTKPLGEAERVRKDGPTDGGFRAESKRDTDTAQAEELIELLLKYGADIGAKNKEGYTALTLAQELKTRTTSKKKLNSSAKENLYTHKCVDKLRKPPVITQLPPSTKPVSAPRDLSGVEREVCESFDAFIMDFYVQTHSKEEQKNREESKEKPKEILNDSRSNQKGDLDASMETQKINPKKSKASQESQDGESKGTTHNMLQRIRSVYDLIKDGPDAIMNEAKDEMVKTLKSNLQDHRHLVRWIHIPANNVYDERPEDYVSSATENSSLKSKRAKTTSSKQAMTTIYIPYLNFESHSSRRQIQEEIAPSANPPDSLNLTSEEDSDRTKKCRSLVRHYLNHSRGKLHIHRTLDQFYYDSIDDTTERDRTQVMYRYSDTLTKPPPDTIPEQNPAQKDAVAPAHNLERKGDKSEADPSIGVQAPREAKASENSEKRLPPGYSENPVIFTVDQLWLWIIDEKTIISSFPERWAEEKLRDLKVLESIQIYLREKGRRRVGSVQEMAALIMSMCLRFVDKCQLRRPNGNLDERFFEAFASSAHREAELFKTFKKGEAESFKTFKKGEVESFKTFKQGEEQNKTRPKEEKEEIRQEGPLKKSPTRVTKKLVNFSAEVKIKLTNFFVMRVSPKRDSPLSSPQGLNILDEIEMLEELRDIRDELNILHKVLRDQKSVVDRAFSKTGLNLNQEARSYYLERTGLASRIAEVAKMEEDARVTYEQLNHLLDLKQKGANIKEAAAAVEQGRIAAGLAREAAHQSRLIFVFTTVTVFFISGAEPGNDEYESRWIFPMICKTSIRALLVSLGIMLIIAIIATIYVNQDQTQTTFYTKYIGPTLCLYGLQHVDTINPGPGNKGLIAATTEAAQDTQKKSLATGKQTQIDSGITHEETEAKTKTPSAPTTTVGPHKPKIELNTVPTERSSDNRTPGTSTNSGSHDTQPYKPELGEHPESSAEAFTFWSRWFKHTRSNRRRNGSDKV
ncbi:MAG: hypothetical protein Q9187_003971 [Circinaria calcarea]